MGNIEKTGVAHLNRVIIHKWYYTMWNEWDKSIIPVITSPDITFTGSIGDEMNGRHELTEYMDKIRRAFPDFHNDVQLILSEGERAFAEVMYSGTHRGEIFDIQATGKRIQYKGNALFEIRDGKIQHVRVLGDIHNLLRQLRE